MTLDIGIVLAVLLGALVFFVLDRWRVDFVALLMMAILVATGVITGREAIAGFSNPATVTVAAMMVLSGALTRTHALDQVGRVFTRAASRHTWTAIGGLLVLVGAISAFINNTAAVAIFLPVVLAIARGAGLAPSKLLIPLSFAGILGGTCTLIGTSTNLLVDSIASEQGQEPFGMFEFLPLGLVLLVVGLLYTMTIGMRLLPERRAGHASTDRFDEERYALEIEIGENMRGIGQPATGAALREGADLEVLEVFRGDDTLRSAGKQPALEAGDVLHVRCDPADVPELRKEEGIWLRRRSLPTEAADVADVAFVEAVIPTNSPLAGRSLRAVERSSEHRAIPVALRHRGAITRGRLEQTRLRAGDLLLLEVPRSEMDRLRSDRALVYISEHEVPRSSLRHLIPAVAIIVATVVLAALNVLPIVAAATIGAVATVAARSQSMEDAYRAIDWQVIFLLAGMLSLGTAMQTTGAARLLATGIMDLAGPLGPTFVVSSFYLLTAALSALMSNNATAALLAPVAISTATSMDVDPRPLVMAVAFGASACFMSPIGYQTNTLVYGPGRYRFSDFLRVGTPLVLIFWIICSLLIPRIWPL